MVKLRIKRQRKLRVLPSTKSFIYVGVAIVTPYVIGE